MGQEASQPEAPPRAPSEPYVYRATTVESPSSQPTAATPDPPRPSPSPARSTPIAVPTPARVLDAKVAAAMRDLFNTDGDEYDEHPPRQAGVDRRG